MIPFTGTPQAWNELIAKLPLTHLLQTWEWSQAKARFGWQPMPFVWYAGTSADSGQPQGSPVAAAMVLKRSLPIRGFARKMCILYIPKGPLMDWSDSDLRACVLSDLKGLASRLGAIFVKLDPDVELGTGLPGSEAAVEFEAGHLLESALLANGWQFSPEQIQFRNTVLIDLSAPEDEMLRRMKQKTRYNIRLAQKKGVTVRAATPADYHLLYRMYAETSVRDGFPIREEAYYQTVWQVFAASSNLPRSPSIPFHEALIAEVDRSPVAGISVFQFAGQAIYLFGMSSDAAREKMPNYLLQWEAMRRLSAAGCRSYNLWGAPDEFKPGDLLWGVFRFKDGFGGCISRTVGAWDYTPSPILYKLYTQIIPRILGVMRARGRVRTKQILMP